MAQNTVYIANTTCWVDVDGTPEFVQKGVTKVDAGHEILIGREHLFDAASDNVHYAVEQATSAPGEKRRRGRPVEPDPEPEPETEPPAEPEPEPTTVSSTGGLSTSKVKTK